MLNRALVGGAEADSLAPSPATLSVFDETSLSGQADSASRRLALGSPDRSAVRTTPPPSSSSSNDLPTTQCIERYDVTPRFVIYVCKRKFVTTRVHFLILF